MMKIRILHTADLHLGAKHLSLGDYARERNEDFLKTFDRLIERAISGGAGLFIVAGDLFDRNQVPPGIIERVRSGFKRLEDCGIPSALVPGTHDGIEGSGSILKSIHFPGSVVLSDPRLESPVAVTVNELRVNLYGLGAKPGDENPLPSMKRRDLPGLHVGLLHATLVKAPQWEVKTRDLPVTPKDLAELGLDYIALGHHHSAQVVEHNGRVVAAYSGSPEGKDFTELGPRQAWWVTVGRNEVKLEPERIETKQLASVEIDLTDAPSVDEAVDAIVGACAEASIARVKLTGSPALDIDLNDLRERAQARFDYLEIVDELLLLPDADLELLARENTVRGAFIRQIKNRMQNAQGSDERERLSMAARLALVEFSRREDR